MKFKYLFVAAAFFGALVSCTEKPVDPTPDDTPEDSADYGSLYLSQAKDSPIEATLDITDAAVTVMATAYLEKAPKEEVSVEMEVNASLVSAFNTQQSASYEAVPESAYSVKTASVKIKAGSFHAGDAVVEVNPAALEAGKSYVLPFAVKSSSYDKINAEKNVVYYIFNITKQEVEPEPEPEVVFTQVMDFGHKVNGEMFCAGSSFILNDYDRTCNLFLYKRDDQGNYAEDREIGQQWWIDGTPFDCHGFIEPNTITFRLGDTFQEFGFNGVLEDAGSFGWLPGAFIGTAGWNTTAIKWIFQFKNITWLTVQGDALIRYDVQYCDPYDPNHWVIIDPAQCGVMVSESGWSAYEKFFCCGNYIFAINAEGKMTAWPFSDDKVIGEPFEMPETWNYQQVVGCEENHFLCLADDGKLYKAELKLFAE